VADSAGSAFGSLRRGQDKWFRLLRDLGPLAGGVVSSPSPTNPQWVAAGKEAAAATGPDFVGIRGFEYSENDGPGGTGHINVLNSEGILNALEPGVDLTAFYKWLAAAKPSGAGPVVASFNHPDAKSYDSFGGRTPETTDIVTMLEVINSNQIIHYEGFLAALDKGWKVSPVAGNDNHGLSGIVSEKSRTFVLAQSRTKAAILDAMKHRRTYASLDNNIQCRYTVNGAMMGSTLARPNEFRFHISLSDPDAAEPKDRITKIDIVKNGGAVVLTYTVPAPAASVEWDPVIQDASSTYFFVRVWNAGGGDAPGANPEKPIAWLAPVWTGRDRSFPDRSSLLRQMSACTPYTAVLAQRPVANIGPAVAEAWIEMTGGRAELHAIVAQADACPSARADGRSLPLVRRTEPKDPSPDFPSTCQLSLSRHLNRLSLGDRQFQSR